MKFSYRMSLLVIHIILGLFFHTLTANGKYCLPHGDKLGQLIQMELSKKKNAIFQFLTTFLKSRSNLRNFEKKMSLIGYVFPKLRT